MNEHATRTDGGVVDDDGLLERGDTGIRMLLTLLFVVIAAAIETVLAVVIVFELLFALITREPPSRRVRELANRIVAYYYRIGRYLTYNEASPPFPFSEFPDALEEDRFDPDVRASESLGLSRRDPEDTR